MIRPGARALFALGLVAACTWPFGRAMAGPWTLAGGEYFFQLGMQRQSTARQFDAAGADSGYPGGQFSDRTISGYLEYGLADPLGLVLSVPFKSVQLGEGAGQRSESGAADATLGLKLGVLSRPIVAAIQVETRVPLGYGKPQGSLLGDDRTDVGISMLLGRSGGPGDGFAQGQLGYRARGRGPADGVFYSLSAGTHPLHTALVLAEFSGVRHVGTGGIEEYRSLGASAYLRVRHGTEVFAAVAHTLSGRSTPVGTRWSVGIALKGTALPQGAGALGQ